jgi:hypothetical protein
MKTKFAAVMNEKKVIGYVYDADKLLRKIDVAGCFTQDGDAVNVRSYKVSHSKRNCERASYTQPVSLHKSGCYTFYYTGA